MYVSADLIGTIVTVLVGLVAILGVLLTQTHSLSQQVDRRFAQFDRTMDQRFAQVDQRLGRIEARMDRADERADRWEAKVSGLAEDVAAIKGQVFKSDVYEAVATQLREMTSHRRAAS